MIGWTWLWVAIALLLLMALGTGLLALIVRTTELYRSEQWALSFLIGTGAGAFLWFVLSPIYGIVSPIWAIGGIAVLVKGAGGAGGARGAKGAGGAGPLERVLGLLLVVECAVMITAALRTPLGWDALFNFEIKARLAMENATPGRLPLAYFSDTTRNWSHPQYPLVVPFAEFWIYSWIGHVDQSAIKILFPLFYLSLIAIVCGAVRRVAGLAMGLGCAVALGLLPPLVVQPGAVFGYADVPLAAAFTGAVSLTMLALRTGNRDALWLAAALSAIAAWTKTEGLMLAMVLGISAFLSQSIAHAGSGVKMPRGALSVLFWLPLLMIAPWLIVQRLYGVPPGDLQRISITTTMENLHRLPVIAGLTARELVRLWQWGFIWPAFVVSLVAMIWKRKVTSVDCVMAAVVSISLALYVLVYVYSAWPDVREHMGWSLSRLLTPLAPIALMFAVRQIWPLHAGSTEWA
ncbi:MAG: hypothetical protein ND807_12360 [Vicinamibacterales bacterium]|nr:hypothetical protein [Vicinamibacterales bacterium]